MVPRILTNSTAKSGTNLLNQVVPALFGGRRTLAIRKDLPELIAGNLLIEMGCKRVLDW